MSVVFCSSTMVRCGVWSVSHQLQWLSYAPTKVATLQTAPFCWPWWAWDDDGDDHDNGGLDIGQGNGDGGDDDGDDDDDVEAMTISVMGMVVMMSSPRINTQLTVRDF